MKILVINLHSSANSGDDVLTQETVRQLNEAFAGASLTLAMNDPESYQGPARAIGSFMTWFKTDSGWRWGALPFLMLMSLLLVPGYRLVGLPALRLAPRRCRCLLRAYFEADLVISSAGNFLYSSGRLGLTFLLAIYTMAYAVLAGKPLYNMPQSIGPLRRRWEKFLVRWVAGQMPLLLVRDALSQEELEAIGAWHAGCRLVPDLAFALPSLDRHQGEQLLRRSGLAPNSGPLLGVTLINWQAQNRLFQGQAGYEAAVAAVIRRFSTTYGGRCVLFAQVRGPADAEDDRLPARRVATQLAELGDAVLVVEEEASAAELKAAYGCMDLFLGTRLHSNIFALTESVPAVAIQYQPKTTGVFQMLGLEKWVIPIEVVNEANLWALLDDLWQEKDRLHRQLRQRLEPIVSDASQIGQLIAEHYRTDSQ